MTFQAKFDRGLKHVQTLEREMGKWIDSHPYYVGVYDEADTGHIVGVNLLASDPPYLDWALAIGECLYNFNSALDQFAYELTKANSPGRLVPDDVASDVQFPIFGNASNLSRLQRMTRGMAPEPRAIIEGLQPYHRGDLARRSDPLWVLRRLGNIDKHRQVHLTPPVATGIAIKEEQDPWFEVLNFNVAPLDHGAEVFRLRRTDLAVKGVQVEFRVTYHIAFSDIADAAQGEPVIPAIYAIHDHILNSVFAPLARFLN
jgi:hypothetical protein